MQKHLGLSLMAYALLGFGLSVEMFGAKAGLSPLLVLGIFITSVLFFLFIVLTSLEKVKKFIAEKSNQNQNINNET